MMLLSRWYLKYCAFLADCPMPYGKNFFYSVRLYFLDKTNLSIVMLSSVWKKTFSPQPKSDWQLHSMLLMLQTMKCWYPIKLLYFLYICIKNIICFCLRIHKKLCLKTILKCFIYLLNVFLIKNACRLAPEQS